MTAIPKQKIRITGLSSTDKEVTFLSNELNMEQYL